MNTTQDRLAARQIGARIGRELAQLEILIQRAHQVAHDAASRGAEAAVNLLRQRGVIRLGR